MAWNLNNRPTDYKLSGRVTSELIDMYGLMVRFYKADLVNEDNILNESQNILLSIENSYDIMVMPEHPEAFEEDDILSKFGMMSMSTTNLFISAKTVDNILESQNDITQLIGGIVKLPSDKMLEVTNVDIMSDGINNMYAYKNQKNVFTLICKPWSYNIDEIDEAIKEEMDFNDENEYVPDMAYVFGIDKTNGESLVQTKAESTIPDDYDPVFGRLG